MSGIGVIYLTTPGKPTYAELSRKNESGRCLKEEVVEEKQSWDYGKECSA